MDKLVRMKMHKLLLLAVACTWAMGAAAEGAPVAAPTAAASATKPAASAPGTGKDKALEEKKAQAEAAEAAKKKADEEKLAKAKADNCTRARQAKAAFDSGKPITQANAQGERIFLDEAGGAAEPNRIAGIIAADCTRYPEPPKAASVSRLTPGPLACKQPRGPRALPCKTFTAGHLGVHFQWAVDLHTVQMPDCGVRQHCTPPDAQGRPVCTALRPQCAIRPTRPQRISHGGTFGQLKYPFLRFARSNTDHHRDLHSAPRHPLSHTPAPHASQRHRPCCQRCGQTPGPRAPRAWHCQNRSSAATPPCMRAANRLPPGGSASRHPGGRTAL